MTLNNKLMLEPYQGSGKIEAKINSGFATVKQKSTLIGLKNLLTTELSMNGTQRTVEKGQMVYFQEEILHANDWSKRTYDCDAIDGRFIIAEGAYAVFIK